MAASNYVARLAKDAIATHDPQHCGFFFARQLLQNPAVDCQKSGSKVAEFWAVGRLTAGQNSVTMRTQNTNVTQGADMAEGDKVNKIYVPIRFPANLLEKAMLAASERWPNEDRSKLIIRIVEQWVNALDGSGRHALTKEILRIVEGQHSMLILLLDAHGLEWDDYRNCDNPPGSE